ncbi:DUF6424 family protein [Streptomyces dysideae]|uniref:DUF6424 family protein n=1 Tax=Streptomyces dysideae TaxID=909626 RepID=UPI00389A11E6
MAASRRRRTMETAVLGRGVACGAVGRRGPPMDDADSVAVPGAEARGTGADLEWSMQFCADPAKVDRLRREVPAADRSRGGHGVHSARRVGHGRRGPVLLGDYAAVRPLLPRRHGGCLRGHDVPGRRVDEAGRTRHPRRAS